MNSKRIFLFFIIVAAMAIPATIVRAQSPGGRKPADLEVSIAAFEDQAGTKPLPNGVDFGGCYSAWVRFTIKNNGGLQAKNFTSRWRFATIT